jgi:hypothetical protein
MRKFAIFANSSVNSYKFFNYAADISDCAGIFKQSIGARNREEIGLSYRPPRLHSLAELVPWNKFLGSLKV